MDALSNICVRARRKLMRLRRRREREVKGLAAAELEYRIAKRMMKGEIRLAKKNAWQELISSIDRDSWGPYKMVLGRLRRYVPRITETVDANTLRQMLEGLFPDGETHDPEETWGNWQGPLQEEHVVTKEAVERAIIGSGQGGNPAPGPDGISLSIWRKISPIMLECLAKVYTTCMETGKFPRRWKRAILVLLPKGEGKGPSGIPKARPVCLLNEVGKLFERILVSHIKRHMELQGSKKLSNRQFGFREKRSTVDALKKATDFINRHTGNGNLVVGVGIDIRNAFNSIPWPTIRWAMERFDFPMYIPVYIRIIDSYLHEREIEFPTCDGELGKRRVTARVPQGSVLGPLLWNIGFDYVLEPRPRPNCEVIAYADDVLVLAAGESPEVVRSRINDQLVPILRRMDQLGLAVEIDKTEAVLFHSLRKRLIPEPILVRMRGVYIETSTQMKYLGVG